MKLAQSPDLLEWSEAYDGNDLDKIEDALESSDCVVLPPKNCLFAAFGQCSPSKVRVVLLGQDPYPKVGLAHGLAFSVNAGIPLPSSLKNIQKEIVSSFPGINMSGNGDLTVWARQGVLLLNTCLSVEIDRPGSHIGNMGWEGFTDKILSYLNSHSKNLVFLLLGKKAQAKASLVDQKKHFVIQTSHPSGLSCHRGFLGSDCFVQTNVLLARSGMECIDWSF